MNKKEFFIDLYIKFCYSEAVGSKLTFEKRKEMAIDQVCRLWIRWNKLAKKPFNFCPTGSGDLDGEAFVPVEAFYMGEKILIDKKLTYRCSGGLRIVKTSDNLAFYGYTQKDKEIFKASNGVWLTNMWGKKELFSKNFYENAFTYHNAPTEECDVVIFSMDEAYIRHKEKILASSKNVVWAKTSKGYMYIPQDYAVNIDGKVYSKEFLRNDKSFIRFVFDHDNQKIIPRKKSIVQKITKGIKIWGEKNTQKLFKKSNGRFWKGCEDKTVGQNGIFFGAEIEKVCLSILPFTWVDKYRMLADGFFLHEDGSVDYEISTPIFTINDKFFWKNLSEIFSEYKIVERSVRSTRTGGHITVSATIDDTPLTASSIADRITPIIHLLYGTNDKRLDNKYCAIYRNDPIFVSSDKYSALHRKTEYILEIRVFSEHMSVEHIYSRVALIDLAIRKNYINADQFYFEVEKNLETRAILQNFLKNEKFSLYQIMYWLANTTNFDEKKLKKIQNILEELCA